MTNQEAARQALEQRELWWTLAVVVGGVLFGGAAYLALFLARPPLGLGTRRHPADWVFELRSGCSDRVVRQERVAHKLARAGQSARVSTCELGCSSALS